MTFLTLDDFKAAIRAEHFFRLLNNDGALQLDCERKAIARVAEHLRGKYDLQLAFAQKADHRSMSLVSITVDLAIYYAYQINDTVSPNSAIYNRMEMAIRQLKEAQAGAIDLGLPLLLNEQTKEPEVNTSISIISAERRNNSV